jgi:hypothetical protein
MAALLIQKVDLTSSQSEIDFSGISGFTDLMLIMCLRSNKTADFDGVAVALNGVVDGFTSIERYSSVSAGTTLADQVVVSQTNEYVGGRCPSASTASGTKGTTKVMIPSYSESGWPKCLLTEYTQVVSSGSPTSTWFGKVGTTWASTVAINSITLYPADGSAWETGSVATLYGLQAA